MKRVILVGLGLIGGSIGLALRRNVPQIELVGVDSRAIIDSERCRNLLSRGVSREAELDAKAIVEDADLVVLAMPVREIASQLSRWLAAGVPVTDCGSTKAYITECVAQSPDRGWFLPGHPMAGRERGGLESADAELFRGRRWIVCPGAVREPVLEVTRQLIRELGAIWTEMTPSEHDTSVALTSHFPQIVASWLSANAGASESKAAGPAFADMTRVAGGSESIWNDIFLTNAASMAKVLEDAAKEFGSLASDLRASPPRVDSLLTLLARARSRKDPTGKT
jgi:prephenate dehydrogenase